jgi:cytochrome c oxidase subunit I+III
VSAVIAERLTRIWETPATPRGWLSTVDHKEIGRRYLVTAVAFLIVGGIEALIIRLQLAWADQSLVSPETYNQIFTMHGATMILWYASPILSGFGNFLAPLMIGARRRTGDGSLMSHTHPYAIHQASE